MTPDDELEALLEDAVSNECAHTVPVDTSVPSGCPRCHAMAVDLAAVVRAAGWRKDPSPEPYGVPAVPWDETKLNELLGKEEA